MNDFVHWCHYLGTAAFAISGIRLAAAKHFDWFGAYVIGFVTAVGGGTTRDLLLGVTPFWMTQPSYLIITGIALVFTFIFRQRLVHLNNTVFLFDTVGLGLFTIAGMAKTLSLGHPWWVGIVMGTITGSFGGMLRDTLINEEPLIFREDIYAIACLLGGGVYALLLCTCGGRIDAAWPQFVAVAFIVLCRIIAVRYHIHIPKFEGRGAD